MMDVNKVYKKCYKNNLWIIAGLYLIGLLVVQLTQQTAYINLLTISAVYSLVTSSIYGGVWKAIASQSPTVMNNFYLVGSGFRMLLAFLTVVVYAMVVKERAMVIGFVVIFMIFYLVLLVFDTVYFYKVEKNNKINN
ncbi:hypothetical protein [Prevotella melaninogenica]|uniref:Uncharacterized protein n=1 Tax=Prevotella melaninogenica DNF00666 TaxID=1401073 RepID=A0A096B4M3_9BACT|nr:hypothetical protein [Prevotella melaninogenica]KGF54010.1 hypothetical protein HMPREF0661_02475 [Prevotella melaninogenica DNF00666]